MMVQTKGIEKWYSSGFVKTHVLRRIDLEIKQGEFTSIMGPSGAGKSTLLYILGALDEPSKGEYLFEGEPVHKMNERQRTDFHKWHVGFVFQSYHLIDELTVYENLETPLLYQKVKGSERKGRVAEMLDRFNIVAKKKLFPNQLSGGEQQRVAVARSVITRPRMILADEPTGNLSSKEGESIMDLFTELNKEGTTIVQATHSEKNAAYASRIIHMSDGWVDSDEARGEA